MPFALTIEYATLLYLSSSLRESSTSVEGVLALPSYIANAFSFLLLELLLPFELRSSCASTRRIDWLNFFITRCKSSSLGLFLCSNGGGDLFLARTLGFF